MSPTIDLIASPIMLQNQSGRLKPKKEQEGQQLETEKKHVGEHRK